MTDATTIHCPVCSRDVTPEICGETTSNGPCQDRVCPTCWADLERSDG